MRHVQVELEGCDDSTVMHVVCTEEEFEFLKKLSVMSRFASEYCCQPRMLVEEVS